jgi:RNA polymerase sigma-B factor
MTETQDGLSPQNPDEAKERERAEERALFARYKANPSERYEEELVEKYRPLVYRIVHKFRKNADQFDDLVQVGTVGLVLAIRRFDLEFNFRFSTYAWQTIHGEIQRYFRDKTWALNVPRDLKERSLKVFNVREELAIELGHEPTVSEVAARAGLSDESVLEAMELGSAYHPQSFMDNSRDSDPSYGLSEDGEAGESTDMGAFKRGIFWDSLLKQLEEKEAKVLRLYFFNELTQKEIAERLSTSQMNVSRIMRLALGKLRGIMAPDDIEQMGNF